MFTKENLLRLGIYAIALILFKWLGFLSNYAYGLSIALITMFIATLLSNMLGIAEWGKKMTFDTLFRALIGGIILGTSVAVIEDTLFWYIIGGFIRHNYGILLGTITPAVLFSAMHFTVKFFVNGKEYKVSGMYKNLTFMVKETKVGLFLLGLILSITAWKYPGMSFGYHAGMVTGAVTLMQLGIKSKDLKWYNPGFQMLASIVGTILLGLTVLAVL